MDFTETPHAEDMLTEMGSLLETYFERGIDPKTAIEILKMMIEDIVLDLEEEE